jgi:hypothetical protein
MEVSGERHSPASVPMRKDSGTLCRKIEVDSRVDLEGYEEQKIPYPPPGASKSDSLARSESAYRLSYPGH